jgi:hypothetical protein
MTARQLFAAFSRLFFFGLFTSFGYLLYSIFLAKVSAAVLTLNTFIWLFLLQCVRYQDRAIKFRWPLASFRWALPSHYVGFALCQFSYWYLFWIAAGFLNNGAEFASLALALLALNTFATPIAMYFAKRNPAERISIAPYIVVAFLLFPAIVLLELDTSWQDLSSRLAFLDEPSSWSIDLGSAVSVVAICLLLAVVVEAVGDFLITRYEVQHASKREAVDKELDVAMLATEKAERYLRETPLERMIEDITELCRSELDTASSVSETAQKQLDDLPPVGLLLDNPDEIRQRAEYQKTEAAKIVKELGEKLTRLKEYETLSSSEPKTVRFLLSRDFTPQVYSYFKKKVSPKEIEAARARAAEGPVDVMSIIGLFISFFVLLPQLRQVDLGMSPWSIILVLSLLGVTGSAARTLFIIPLLRHKEAAIRHKAEALIPPIYAVRPLIFLMLGVLLLNVFGLADWIQKTVPVQSNIYVLPRRLTTYWMGAAIAILAAGCSWWFAIRPKPRRR